VIIDQLCNVNTSSQLEGIAMSDVDIDTTNDRVDSVTDDIESTLQANNEKVNKLNLLLLSQKIFSAIHFSSRTFPVELKNVLNVITSLMRKYHPSVDVRPHIGVFLFNRFVCLGVTSPHHYGLLSTFPDANSQQSLTFTAKILQSLAKGATFTTRNLFKDDFYVKLNDFITSNTSELKQIIENVSVIKDTVKETDDVIPDTAHYEALSILKENINSHKEPIFHKLELKFTENMEELNLYGEYKGEPEKLRKAKQTLDLIIEYYNCRLFV